MTTDLYNKEYEKVGTVDLPEYVFGMKWIPKLVHQVILAQQANRRAPVAHSKDRHDVRGGGKKPYAQKHTGRSRQGSIRSPLWSGGGATFGPRNERDFSQKVNKKMKRQALYSLLSEKQRKGDIFVIDSLELKEAKTREIIPVISAFLKKKGSLVIIPSQQNTTVSRAARNIPKTLVLKITGLNPYDCAAHQYIMFEKEAIEEFEKSKK